MMLATDRVALASTAWPLLAIGQQAAAAVNFVGGHMKKVFCLSDNDSFRWPGSSYVTYEMGEGARRAELAGLAEGVWGGHDGLMRLIDSGSVVGHGYPRCHSLCPSVYVLARIATSVGPSAGGTLGRPEMSTEEREGQQDSKMAQYLSLASVRVDTAGGNTQTKQVRAVAISPSQAPALYRNKT